jgi:glycosyltransferase involved in cell wall biosynthesis
MFGGFIPEDSFIFMTLGTNTERKKLDLVIEAFNLFLKKVYHPDKYYLYIHTNPNEISGGTDLISQAMSLGILNKLLFPSSYANNQIMSQEELYSRISIMDCYIGLPSGEGFGYGFADAMIHGIPLIYINYGGHVEYCKDAGLSVKVKSFYNSKNAYMKWAIADIEDASEQMLLIVQDKKLREKLGNIGKQSIKNISWEIQSKKFIDLIMNEYNKVKDLKNDLHKNFYLKRII